MKDGMTAAESIDRYLRGKDLRAGREKQYQEAPMPVAAYKAQLELVWKAAEHRMGFDIFEKRLTLFEAVTEAKRCLHCGPCLSCKACVMLGFQPEIPEVEVNQEVCSACGVCVVTCNSDATRLTQVDGRKVSVIDPAKCKHCGVCVAACPVEARKLTGEMLTSELASALA
jgi:heterodisulfide reductase subunit A-like polyferredoxin